MGQAPSYAGAGFCRAIPPFAARGGCRAHSPFVGRGSPRRSARGFAQPMCDGASPKVGGIAIGGEAANLGEASGSAAG